MLKIIYYRGKNYTVSFDSYLNTVNIISTNISTGRQFRCFMVASIVREQKNKHTLTENNNAKVSYQIVANHSKLTKAKQFQRKTHQRISSSNEFAINEVKFRKRRVKGKVTHLFTVGSAISLTS